MIEEEIVFPRIDLTRLAVPLDRCVVAPLGSITQELLDMLEKGDFDQAPVVKDGIPIGVISRQHLRELHEKHIALTGQDPEINRVHLEPVTEFDKVLDVLAEHQAAIVRGTVNERVEYVGLVTRSDLNKHPVRVMAYEILARFEMALAQLVAETFSDPWEWLKHLDDDRKARILGYWELAKRRNVDTGPVASITLTELNQVLKQEKQLYRRLGLTEKTVKKLTNSLPEFRNRVMHPVRPLVTDGESCSQLKNALCAALELTQRTESALTGGCINP